MATPTKVLLYYITIFAVILIAIITSIALGLNIKYAEQWSHIMHGAFALALLLTVFGIKEIRRDDLKISSPQRIVFTILAIVLLFTALFC